MRKKQLNFWILILGLSLFSSPKSLFAAQTDNSVNISPDSVAQASKSFYDTITQPFQLKISLSKRRVTLYQGEKQIKSYPIAIGRKGWETPKGTFQVIDMRSNPIWIHPLTGQSIKAGDPKNPLGKHWIGFWTDGTNWVGFHGTPNPNSVGKAASHGCIRMYNKDIQELFQKVSLGTPVTVVQ